MHTIDYIHKLKEAKFNDEQITAIATIKLISKKSKSRKQLQSKT